MSTTSNNLGSNLGMAAQLASQSLRFGWYFALQRLVDRSWTLKPDELELARKGTRVRWTLVDSTASLARGAVRLSGIDGPSSEGAVMVFVPATGFLWAGDYIQDASEASVYAREVMAAAKRAGFQPGQVAAQHLPLTPWEKVTAANP